MRRRHGRRCGFRSSLSREDYAYRASGSTKRMRGLSPADRTLDMRTHAVLTHLVVTMIAAPAAVLAACAANPTPSSNTGPTSAAEAPHPDTKAEPGNCDFYNYYHDESRNSAGASKCATDCDCDGMRSCKSGTCQGEARAKVDCNSPSRHWNEAWNPQGAGKCTADCDCDGRRTCQAGVCQGVAC